MARCCHEHVAGSIADRVAFWGALHQRLGKLSNRFSHETHGKLIGQIHARIPMPTVDEQRQLQKENAEADEQLWSTLHDMNASTAADHKGIGSHGTADHCRQRSAAKDAAAKADQARERLAKIERGEDVQGGLGKPMTYEQAERMLLDIGLTKGDIRHMQRTTVLHGELERLGIEQDFLGRLEQAS